MTRCPAHVELQAKVDRILADADPIDLRDPAIDLTDSVEVREEARR